MDWVIMLSVPQVPIQAVTLRHWKAERPEDFA
jgi:hypothetical protein